MFDTAQPRLRLVRLDVEAKESPPEEEDTLKKRCLHPAEAWVLKRRANRVFAPPRRLPAVARVG